MRAPSMPGVASASASQGDLVAAETRGGRRERRRFVRKGGGMFGGVLFLTVVFLVEQRGRRVSIEWDGVRFYLYL